MFEGTLVCRLARRPLVAALNQQGTRRVTMDKGGPVNQGVSFPDPGQRLRDVRVRLEGALYLLADEAQGALLRAVPR